MNHNNKIFMLACIANGASFSMILPLLAPLIRELELTELQGGAMVSVGSLLMALSAMYIARHQQKYSVYQLLSGGFLGMTLTWAWFSGVLMYGLLFSISAGALFFLLMLSRASTGIFMAMPQIALQSHVMLHHQGEQQRSQSMAKFGALGSVGLILGPLFTTILLNWGILVPLWTAIVILAVLSILILISYNQNETRATFLAQNPDPALQGQQDSLEQPSQPARTDFSLHPVLLWLILGFSLYLAIITLNLTAGFYIQDHFNISAQQGAVYFSQCAFIAGISLVSMQILISKYLHWSVSRLLWVGLVSMLAGLLISLSTRQLIIFQSAYVLYGIGIACLTPAFITGAAQTAPQDMQTKVAAWCTATQALSFVVGPLISTGLYQLNPVFPYYFLSVLLTGIGVYMGSQLLTYSH